jgi:molybdate transport system substrate-binding protein
MKTIRILSGGAAHGLVKRLEPALLAATGCGIDGVFSAVGGHKNRLLGGEQADVAILTAAIIGELEQKGIAIAGQSRAVGRVSTAVAVRSGDTISPITTADDLRAALTSASSIYFPDPQQATAGIHFANVLKRLGIDTSTVSRHRTFPNGATAMAALAAATDERPIGCTQLTEIVSTQGVRLIGDLPGDLGLATTYTAAALAGGHHPDAVTWLIAALAAPHNQAIRAECGFHEDVVDSQG